MSDLKSLIERVRRRAESQMHAWDDDVTNNNRFMDGEECMVFLTELLAIIEEQAEALDTFRKLHVGLRGLGEGDQVRLNKLFWQVDKALASTTARLTKLGGAD